MLSVNSKKDVQVPIRWIKYTMYLAASIYLIWILTTILFFSGGQSSWRIFYPLWISISIITYWVGFKGTAELKISNEREVIRNSRVSVESLNSNSISGPERTKKGSLLFAKIVEEIKEESLYLRQDLSLETLAEMFDISPGYLSQLVNKHSKQSFSELINQYRVEEVKHMLLNNDFSGYTMEAIGLEAGFNTKSNFYMVFKKTTGMTPNAYKKVQNL